MTEREWPEGHPFAGARRQLEQAIAHLEAQRAALGSAAMDAALAGLRQELAALAAVDSASPRVVTGPVLAGERKLVTVMFADISGFTALAETMDPEAVRDLMNDCFERLVPVVEKYEGTVDKFIGDEIMALFGAPVAHENDPERALRAALEMMDALAKFNVERCTDLGLHFGINTGLVIAGGLGTRERQEYSVMGDAVNLAARLEDASERGEILVGPDTYRLTASLFKFETLEPIRVKGKADPVPAYRLLASRAIRGQVRGIAGLGSPLVGREAESRALREAVERLRAGAGGIVTLMGEAGLGKSRLVAEVRALAFAKVSDPSQGCPPLQWTEGRCLSYGTSVAYLPWLDVLRGLLGVMPEAPPPATRDKLRERVQALCPGQVKAVYPYLARLMSLPLEVDSEAFALRDLEGEGLKASTFGAVETLLEGAAWDCPLVVVCEDLHWADPTSVELLEELLAVTDRAPLLLICAFRPETQHGCWRIKEGAARHYPHRHTDLSLDPLSTAECETLMDNLLRAGDWPQEFKECILSHAEGNPFYVEEILRALMDSGTIVGDESSDRWRVTRELADIDIPDTLHGVLMARIDRLQEETKRVLQLAAVVGRTFLYRALAAIVQEEPELDGHLLTLRQEEMIRERAQVPELEYIFKHHLTQEAAYKGLLRKERRVYHRRVAEALEQLFPERVEEQLGLLAYHWELAREPDAKRAVEYLSRAGDQARLAYAHAEAIDYYRRALELTPENRGAERAHLKTKLGEVLQAQGKFDDAVDIWEQALSRRQEIDSTPDQVAALHRLIAHALWSKGQIEEARNHLATGLLWLGEQSETPEAAALYQEMANQALHRGDSRAAIEWAQKALDLSQRLEAYQQTSLAANTLGVALVRNGEARRGLDSIEQSRRIAEEHNLPVAAGRATVNLAVLYSNTDPLHAAALCEQGLVDAQRTGHVAIQSWFYTTLAGSLYACACDYETATLSAQMALELDYKLGQYAHLPVPLIILGQIHACYGRWAEAEAYYQQALSHAKQLADPQLLFPCLEGLGALYLQRGDQARGQAYLERAQNVCEESGFAMQEMVLLPFFF